MQIARSMHQWRGTTCPVGDTRTLNDEVKKLLLQKAGIMHNHCNWPSFILDI